MDDIVPNNIVTSCAPPYVGIVHMNAMAGVVVDMVILNNTTNIRDIDAVGVVDRALSQMMDMVVPHGDRGRVGTERNTCSSIAGIRWWWHVLDFIILDNDIGCRITRDEEARVRALDQIDNEPIDGDILPMENQDRRDIAATRRLEGDGIAGIGAHRRGSSRRARRQGIVEAFHIGPSLHNKRIPRTETARTSVDGQFRLT